MTGEYDGSLFKYDGLDSFKRIASEAAAQTAGNMALNGLVEESASRGESAQVWREGDELKAGLTEGLGSKNLVADAVDKSNPEGESKYRNIAQDSMAMIVNDLAVVGASPELFWMHMAVGSDSWFADERRARALVEGTRDVCNNLQMTWLGGETPGLKGMVYPDAAIISGTAIGRIGKEERYVRGTEVEEGDRIFMLPSSGIHANGLTDARALAERLPDGYDTELSDGSKFGETLLTPTHLYVDFVQAALDAGIQIKRLENMTGHGWRKIMRGPRDFTYRMTQTAPRMPIFDFLQEQYGVSDEEMYKIYNMGVGFAAYIKPEFTRSLSDIANDLGFEGAGDFGSVEAGPKQVIIEPLNVILDGVTLAIR
jgi:phosphoribosylformylglycinamidine cyclo-ligase